MAQNGRKSPITPKPQNPKTPNMIVTIEINMDGKGKLFRVPKKETASEPKLGKSTERENLASMLVTQVQYGQSKPYVPANVTMENLNNAKPNIVLGPQKENDIGKKTLVLDLDETLVHSSFQPVKNCDLILPVVIENQTWHVYVLKRPGVDKFLEKMAQIYEIVIYTASLSKYADPLLDWLDPKGLCSYRLFREHCTFYNGIFIKDLSRLARNLKNTIIIDNSPASYMRHTE